jgi:hypothetical protein
VQNGSTIVRTRNLLAQAVRPARSRLFASVLALPLCVGAVACHHLSDVRPPNLAVQLHVSGNPDAPDAVHYSPALKLYVEPVVDERDDKTRIGVNNERAPEVPILASPEMAPGAFVGQIVVSQFATSGVKTVPDVASANRVLRLRLTRFFTEEGGTYQSEVGATAEVRGLDDKVLFSFAVTGSAKKWGSSLEADNYNEVFSSAAFDFAKNLVELADFQKAVDVGAAPVSPPAH